MRSLGFRVVNEFTDVPAEGVDQFLFAVGHGELPSFVADAGQVSACGRLIGCASVVVAELDQYVVAGFHLSQQLVPQAFVEKGSCAAACKPDSAR